MMRALIVDDKQENLYLLRALLQGHGWTVDEAINGAEALAIAIDTPPDLVISDLLMPVMDGYTLLRRWKSDERFRKIPFVVYTATYTEPKDERLALDLGADAFIIKPVEPEPFMECIQEVLEKKARGEMSESSAPKSPQEHLFKKYSEVLVNKLEAKVLQLENINRSLKEEIARRQQIEAELLQSRRDWEDIFQSIGHPTIVMDRENQILAANKECLAVTGKSFQELLNLRCYEVFQPKGGRPEGCPMAALLESGSADKLEREMELLGGYYLVSCTPIFDDDGAVRGAIQIATDISERKRLEDEIRFNNVLLSTQQEASIDGILVVSEDRRILSFNSRFVDMWAVDADIMKTGESALVLRSALDKVADPDGFIDKVTRFYDYPYETGRDEVALKDGRTLDRYSAPMLGANGEYYGRVWYFRDVTEQKRAEEALEERERAWSTLINNLPGFAYRCASAPDWTMLYVSKGCIDITGFQPDDLIDNKVISYNDIIHPNYRKPLRKKWQDLLARKAVCETEYPIVTRNGETRWVWERGQGVFGDDGELMFLEGFVTDITERKRGEDQIRLNETRLRSIQNIAQYKASSAQDLLDFALSEAIKLTGSEIGYIYHYDEDKRLFELNTWSTGVMKQCEVAQPQTLYDLDKTGIWGEAVRQRRPITVNDFQAPNPLKKGYPDGHVKLRNFMTVPVIVDDKIVSVVGMANKDSAFDENDVLQTSLLMDSVWRIQESKRLEMVQRRLATAVEFAAECVVITNVDGTIEYVSKACELMTGYTKEEMVGRTPGIFKSGEHDQAFYEEMWKTINAGNVWSGRVINRRKDGRLYHGDATISPVRDSSGAIVNFVGVERDITEKLELSKQLFQAQKMEAVGNLAGGVAHDFNNILQVALGYSDLILADEDLPEHYRNDVQRIHEAASRGADLVQRLLTLSRRTDIKPRPLNLNHRLKDLRMMLERTLPKMIDIQLSLGDKLAAINGDPTQVDQVLMNLAVNARDAMPNGGKLVFETTNITIDEDSAAWNLEAEAGEYVLLSVSDTGSGMDKETVSRIFEPFFTTKEAGEGTGLGLAMVFGIVKQHEGHVTCYSEPGHGTRFNIYFPALAASQEQERAKVEAPPPGGHETILIVDDEDLIRDLGSKILTRAGYKVISASGGKEALEICQREDNDISLVILDLIMPEIGGAQCLQDLLIISPTMKVVIASGFSVSGQTKETLTTGARGFVNKPYNIRQMLGVVREVLDSE